MGLAVGFNRLIGSRGALSVEPFVFSTESFRFHETSGIFLSSPHSRDEFGQFYLRRARIAGQDRPEAEPSVAD